MPARERVEIYAPSHFKPTWVKFREMCARDGQSASELVRIWITRYVSVKDPSNPQRPLEAFDPTLAVHYEANANAIFGSLLSQAQNEHNEISFKAVMAEFRDLPVVRTRLFKAREMAKRLVKEGIKVWK